MAAQPASRDALIEELRRRIDVLEKRLEDRPAAPPPAPAPPVKAAPPTPKPAASEEAGREDEGARALERTLVRTGGLVLPRGRYEFEPRIEYSYRGSDQPRIVTVGGVAQIAQQDLTQNKLEASLGIRAGLPWSMQAEMRLPYVWLHENRAEGGIGQSERRSGLGDVEIGLARQLAVEQGGRPAVLGSLNWKTTTGNNDPGRLSPGSGFPQLQGTVTAVKREDPLVFFGAASYTAILERERSGSDVDPGDALTLKAGTILAASPETSLRAAFEVGRVSRTRIGGSSVAGSDATVGVLELGLATLASTRALLDIEIAIGLTPDTPDFSVRLALPIRF
ncbi:MAG: transporter [Betaproteobacteria bacterium]